MARLDVGFVPTGDEGAMSWIYRGKLIAANAGEPAFTTTSIGREPSAEVKRAMELYRARMLRQIEQRRKRDA